MLRSKAHLNARLCLAASWLFFLYAPRRTLARHLASPVVRVARTHRVMDSRCVNRVTTGAALGATVGGAVGACYGTYEAFAYKLPGALKVRHIGRATIGSSALFGLFLGAGSLLQCGRR
jgi:hypothetical protein